MWQRRKKKYFSKETPTLLYNDCGGIALSICFIYVCGPYTEIYNVCSMYKIFCM